MRHRSGRSSLGFTLLEMMISLALGLLVIGTAVQLFSQGVDATWVISQKAEMQQDLRAASGLLLKDISLAGAGLPTEQGIALPTGTGTKSIYGCNQSGTCLPNGAVAYPNAPSTTTPTMYPIIPGYQLGVIPTGGTVKSDLITVVYSDPVLALSCYTITWPKTGATPVTFTAPAVNPPPASCILPTGITFPQSLTDNVVGLKPGDVLLFTQGSLQAAAEVSSVTPANIQGQAPLGQAYSVTFTNADPMQLNQHTATAGDLIQLAGGANTSATRINVITYYLKNQPDPLGIGNGTPVLMRQVNGQTAIPVAENVVNFQFNYDTYDTSGNLLSAQGDGGYSAGVGYNLIRKINVVHLTMRSQMAGTRSQLMATKGFQTFDFQTSISARNSSYQNRYSF